MADIFAAVDLGAVSAFVGGAMLIVVAVALAFKAGILGKRVVRSV